MATGEVSPLAEVAVVEDSVRSDHDAQTTGGFTAEMVGMVVSVDRRMWPGINKPGGIGIISKVHDDGAIDVKYTVVGGREAKIHPQYVRLKNAASRSNWCIRESQYKSCSDKIPSRLAR